MNLMLHGIGPTDGEVEPALAEEIAEDLRAALEQFNALAENLGPPESS